MDFFISNFKITSDNLFATTAPALPAPTTMKSYFRLMLSRLSVPSASHRGGSDNNFDPDSRII